MASADALRLSDEELIYYGSRRVRLAHVGGEVHAFESAAWVVDMSDEALA